MLDPYDPDTNHNGIPDNIDASPRSMISRSDKTTVYESLIAEIFIATGGAKNAYTSRSQEKWTSDSLLMASNIEQKIKNTSRTIMIVSDDSAILGIKNSNKRVIVLSGKEYELYKEKNVNSPEKCFISPLFKVDNMPDTYTMSAGMGPAYYQYRVQKINDRWFLYLESFSIS